MIYTCTLNPSVDYYLHLDELKKGMINRSKEDEYKAGGKGVNVSIVLNNFKIPSIALGFLGGFVREHYLSYFSEYPFIQPLFSSIQDTTRINIKIVADDETDINGKGPQITDEEWNKILVRTNKIECGDIFILSGNVQEKLYDQVEGLIEELSKRKVTLILDTNPKLLKRLLKYQPILIKPNIFELEEMFDEKIDDIDVIINKAKELFNDGAANVIVSLGKQGSICVSGSDVYRSNPIKTRYVNTTGAGDSMVAGFVLSLLRGANSLEAYRYSVAAAVATVSSEDLAVRDLVEKYYEEIEIEVL